MLQFIFQISDTACNNYTSHNKTNWVCYSAVDCGLPIKPINGNLGEYFSTRERVNVTFQCNDGYVPSVTNTATCNNHGMWEPAPEEHNCTFVEGKAQGNYVYNHLYFLSACVYVCLLSIGHSEIS